MYYKSYIAYMCVRKKTQTKILGKQIWMNLTEISIYENCQGLYDWCEKM